MDSLSKKTQEDCSKPKGSVPPLSDDELAERYSLGHPGSEEARFSTTGVIRNPHGFVGRPTK